MTTRIPIRGPYHLHRTLASGQCFRWTPVPGGARIVVDGTAAVVTAEPGALSVAWQGQARSPAGLRRYLGADEPLPAIEASLARDRAIARLLPHTSGIAIMRQDPWETLIAFVISSFNNIPKIRLSVERLSRRLGEPIRAWTGGEPIGWTFPTAAALAGASPAVLGECALGYRAPYVRAIARLAADGGLDPAAIRTMPYGDARARLLDLPGVGEKVVECVLLFAFGHGEAFPVDVWVRRAIERWYPGLRGRAPRAIRAWARGRFGPLAGYAQQHLFAGARALRIS